MQGLISKDLSKVSELPHVLAGAASATTDIRRLPYRPEAE